MGLIARYFLRVVCITDVEESQKAVWIAQRSDAVRQELEGDRGLASQAEEAPDEREANDRVFLSCCRAPDSTYLWRLLMVLSNGSY